MLQNTNSELKTISCGKSVVDHKLAEEKINVTHGWQCRGFD